MLTLRALMRAARLDQAYGRGPKHPLECSGDYAARMRRATTEECDGEASDDSARPRPEHEPVALPGGER